MMLAIHTTAPQYSANSTLDTYSMFLAPFYSIDFSNGVLDIAARVDALHLSKLNETLAIKIGFCANF